MLQSAAAARNGQNTRVKYWNDSGFSSALAAQIKNPHVLCRRRRLLQGFGDSKREFGIYLQKPPSSATFFPRSCRGARPLQVFEDCLAEKQAFCKFSGFYLQKPMGSARFSMMPCRRRLLPQGCADLLAAVAGFCKSSQILLQKSPADARFSEILR